MARIGAGAGTGAGAVRGGASGHAGNGGVVSLMRLREEALHLLDDARLYLAQAQQAANSPVPAALRLVAACETLRMTARLTQIVAWLTVRRAAQEAGLTGETEAPELRLGARDVCAAATPPSLMLSPQLGDLLERSAQLYQRAARLDDLLEPKGFARA
jgi:regulator of CtrA degradation